MNDKHTISTNRHQRRYLDSRRKREAKKRINKTNANRVELTDHIVYTDDSYKDKHKVSGGKAMEYLKKRIADKNKIFHLPKFIKSTRDKLLTTALLVNKDGHQHAFLPDRPPRHCLLVHRNVARALVSGCCMFARITSNVDDDGNIIDGSWAITPAEYRMMQATTIQTLRRRPFWFLRRYHYEISFDGRVQPAHLLYDYGLNPESRRQRLFVTREYVPIRGSDKKNDYFRLWLHKPAAPK